MLITTSGLPAVLLTAQDNAPGLAGWQVVALYVGVPAAAFLAIMAVVLRASARPTRGAGPVLRRGPTTVDEATSADATKAEETPEGPVTASHGSAGSTGEAPRGPAAEGSAGSAGSVGSEAARADGDQP